MPEISQMGQLLAHSARPISRLVQQRAAQDGLLVGTRGEGPARHAADGSDGVAQGADETVGGDAPPDHRDQVVGHAPGRSGVPRAAGDDERGHTEDQRDRLDLAVDGGDEDGHRVTGVLEGAQRRLGASGELADQRTHHDVGHHRCRLAHLPTGCRARAAGHRRTGDGGRKCQPPLLPRTGSWWFRYRLARVFDDSWTPGRHLLFAEAVITMSTRKAIPTASTTRSGRRQPFHWATRASTTPVTRTAPRGELRSP